MSRGAVGGARGASEQEVRDVAAMQSHFARFAEDHPGLRLYRAICLGAAADPRAAALLLEARPGQARPVLWLAALHDLVLRRPDLPAARWYPSVVGHEEVPEGDPWPDVLRTVLAHADELRETIATRSTQTNEVNRAVCLAAGLALVAADVPDAPVDLVELGASAGLLLGVDRYRIELASAGSTLVLGDPASPVRCAGEDRSTPPLDLTTLPTIGSRVGIDLHPVRLDDPVQLRWLEACLWPDVPGRVERFRTAVAALREQPPRVRRADMVDDLPATIAAAAAPQATGHHLVVFSSWALTYVPRSRRPAVARALRDVATGGMPVSWLSAEPSGCVPGIPVPAGLTAGDSATVLGARRWRAGRELAPIAWGTCHPHGQWIDLSSDAVEGGG